MRPFAKYLALGLAVGLLGAGIVAGVIYGPQAVRSARARATAPAVVAADPTIDAYCTAEPNMDPSCTQGSYRVRITIGADCGVNSADPAPVSWQWTYSGSPDVRCMATP